MKIGILGTGEVGKALARGFVQTGHTVHMGTRDPRNAKAVQLVAQLGKDIPVVSFEEAAILAEVAVLATLWSGTENALKLANPKNLAGKVVIDTTNPLVISPGSLPRLAVGQTDSGGEQVQRWLPQSKVVKAFNIVGNRHMVNPDFPGGPPDMFICGNDAGAKKVVTDILTSFHWSTIDIGMIEGARLLEPLCILWVLYGAKTNSWNHAFKLLRKNG
ncbi:MAG TPA: NAD(P)-binding domain-containing protein [Bacteroidota bacterium]|nr:NAD(P)-binding domain-containing protein [Bacteroidota bacterium]